MQQAITFLISKDDFNIPSSYSNNFMFNYLVLSAYNLNDIWHNVKQFLMYDEAANVAPSLSIKKAHDIIFCSNEVHRPVSYHNSPLQLALKLKENKFNYFIYTTVFTPLMASSGYTTIILKSLSSLCLFFSFCIFMLTLLYLVPVHLFSSDEFIVSPDNYGLVESEKEIGPVDDLLLPLMFVLLASVGWFFLLAPLQVVNIAASHVDSLILLMFVCIIVSLPINLLYECGFFFSTFFRGASGSTSSIMELVYDLIANTAMFARMHVQHVRVLLGLVMFLETAAYIESLSIHQLITNTEANNWSLFTSHNSRSTESGLQLIITLISQAATLIAEIGHYIMFLLQSSASYAALIFWFFSLLYSGFFKDTLEMYFAWKKSVKKD